MFDLKAKLLAQGLVTKEQVDACQKKKSAKNQVFDRDRAKARDQLAALPKGEQYVMIRKWVDINRLDKEAHAGLACEKFFVATKDNQVTWLSLLPSVIEEIARGKAGVISYMSNHGLTHAVVPRDIAEDVALVFPDWLKVLHDLEQKNE